MLNKIIQNLEVQFNKVFRHLKTGSYKTRERYKKAFLRFIKFLAEKFHLQKLANISPTHIFAYTDYMQNEKHYSAAMVKNELAAIRFIHDNMPYTRHTLPTNSELGLERRTFGGVDRTWTGGEYNSMLAVAMKHNRNDLLTIFALARYCGLRIEECFRIDWNDATKALETGMLYVKGKGGLTRYVPINASVDIPLRKVLDKTPKGKKLFVEDDDKTHLAIKRVQCFISYHRKSFTQDKITFHGLRHTYAHEKYENFIKEGFTDYEARIKVSELLGHQRDDVTRIYLADGDEDA